ncbi:MAG: glycosyltransferase [Elusimicrobiota bacterium]
MENTKKKVLILTASYGSGHNAAAKGLLKAFGDVFPNEIDAEIIDLTKVGNPKATKLWMSLYETAMLRYIRLWDSLLHFTDTFQGATRFFDMISHASYGDMEEVLEQKKPDIFVSVHPYWTPFITKYNAKYGKEHRLIEIVTDSIAVHCSWYLQMPDFYIVPNEETKEVMIKKDVPDNIIRTYGFPVNTLLGKPVDKIKMLADLGLQAERTTFMVNFGLGEIGNIRKLFEFIVTQKDKKVQVIAICGKRDDIYKQLSARKYDIPVKIIGWTDKMYDFLRLSDIVISKSGGAIVMESIAAGKPILNPEFSPYQEQGNSALLLKYNAGYLQPNINKMLAFVKEIVDNPAKAVALQNGAKKLSNPFAAENIAKFVYELLSTR